MTDQFIPTEEAFAQVPIESGDATVLPVRKDFRVLNLEVLEDTPSRRRGSFMFDDVASLIAYAKTHGDETAELFSSAESSMTIYLRSHQCEPSWMDYKATMKLSTHPWLSDWLEIDNHLITQERFSEFIEDHLDDVIEPDPATVLEIVTHLEGCKRVNFKNATRLTSGDTRLVYEETTEAKAGEKGELSVPTELKLRLPVYEQDPGGLYEFVARFRFRVKDGSLMFQIKLVRPELAKASAFVDITKAVQDELSIPTYSGMVARSPRDCVSATL